MAKPVVIQTPAKPAAAQAPRQPETQPNRLSWPQSPKELSEKPRSFRIHRLNAYEWQAFVTDCGKESPIGKPDLFEILNRRIAGVMRAEGQMEFMAAKEKTHA